MIARSHNDNFTFFFFKRVLLVLVKSKKMCIVCLFFNASKFRKRRIVSGTSFPPIVRFVNQIINIADRFKAYSFL